MDTQNNISIVVASDNHYALLIVALLKSIDVNHRSGEHIDFHIIDDGITPSFREKLENIVDPNRITIKWFKSKDVVPADIKLPIDSSAFPLTTYMRLFAPYIVDQNIDKVIYLDVDIILQDDISKLWSISLGDYIIGAIQDVCETVDSEWAGIANYRDLGLEPKTKYFNAGVLLINAKKWRLENISNRVVLALTQYKDYVRLGDQYGLNVALAKKWLELDPKWNWFAFKEDVNPYLIHFLDIKPIFTSYNSQEIYKVKFFNYLAMTPWKGFKPINGNHRLLRKIYNRVRKTLLKI